MTPPEDITPVAVVAPVKQLSGCGCKAPVFGSNALITCILLTIFVWAPLLIILGILALLGGIFSEKYRCYMKQVVYRSRFCTKGNLDPDTCID